MTTPQDIEPGGMENMTIRVPHDLRDTLNALAEFEGRTLSDYVRRALKQHATTATINR